MRTTIVIGPTLQVADNVALYLLRQEPRKSDARFIACTARTAEAQLLGRDHGTRVVLVDYLKWRPAYAGGIQSLWRAIWIMRDFRGAEVVWW